MNIIKYHENHPLIRYNTITKCDKQLKWRLPIIL